jgi:hypothetical protein
MTTKDMRYVLLTMVNTKNTLFWDVTPHNLIDGYQHKSVQGRIKTVSVYSTSPLLFIKFLLC